MIFVDAGAWYALATPLDPDHESAKLLAAAANEAFVTSDYIVDELLTLFTVRAAKAEGNRMVARRAGARRYRFGPGFRGGFSKRRTNLRAVQRQRVELYGLHELRLDSTPAS